MKCGDVCMFGECLECCVCECVCGSIRCVGVQCSNSGCVVHVQCPYRTV